MDNIAPNSQNVKLPCYHCDKEVVAILSESGPHLRADCSECGRYLKFLSRKSLTRQARISSYQTPAPAKQIPFPTRKHRPSQETLLPTAHHQVLLSFAIQKQKEATTPEKSGYWEYAIAFLKDMAHRDRQELSDAQLSYLAVLERQYRHTSTAS